MEKKINILEVETWYGNYACPLSTKWAGDCPLCCPPCTIGPRCNARYVLRHLKNLGLIVNSKACKTSRWLIRTIRTKLVIFSPIKRDTTHRTALNLACKSGPDRRREAHYRRFIYRQHCGIVIQCQRSNLKFFAPQGRHVAPMVGEIWHGGVDLAKFHCIGAACRPSL